MIHRYFRRIGPDLTSLVKILDLTFYVGARVPIKPGVLKGLVFFERNLVFSPIWIYHVAMDAMNLPISTPFLITFDAGDPGGIMFFPNFFVYTQRAWEHQLEAHGVGWKEWYDHPEWAVPLKHVEADYFKMVRAGSRVEIFQGVEALGDSSVTLAHEFRDSSGAVCARLKTVHVFLNKLTLKKISVPPMIRKYLESLLVG